MVLHLKQRGGLGAGLSWITAIDELDDPTGIALGVWRFDAGAATSEVLPSETALMIMSGEIELEVGEKKARFSRRSLFDDAPWTLHAASGERVSIRAITAAELTIYRTANQRRFESKIYPPSEVRDEQRGKGFVGDTALRLVRTVFDRTNAPTEAELVLGEVVTLPGRWSSYPPHHHPQPEIYHYRFDKPGGYGHCELGDEVLKVRDGDTVKILDGRDHPQCAAPGYAMYYAWVIRHLPDRPYEVPEFDPAHSWTMKPGATVWRPSFLDGEK
jgi:5-deoxy-glucuronate isomerase